MSILSAENRNTELKPKQLRKKGFIPGVLYGKNLEQSLNIQFSLVDAARFLKSNAVGSKAELVIGDKKFPALLREVTYKSGMSELEHLSFQTLLAGEIITSTARIVLVNREKTPGVEQLMQSEVSYRALPAHLIERIEIDLEGMQVGDSIRISDLDIANNPNLEILTPPDALVLSIGDSQRLMEEPEPTEEEPAAESE